MNLNRDNVLPDPKECQETLSTSRILDLTVAILACALLSPVILLIAVAIYTETGRPILFSQSRLGRGGRPFRIYKFRKFNKESCAAGLPLTARNDPRMTRVGHFLARTKLDELPQFWNVLKGDMSMVGPRPESLDFASCFTDPYRSVLDYKPGIFGPTQVILRNEWSQFPVGVDPVRFYREVLFPQKALSDLSYYPHRTIVSDLGWMVRGVLAVAGWRLAPESMGHGAIETDAVGPARLSPIRARAVHLGSKFGSSVG
jgi:lipopolysaccharide/colanic/teichoic acid biosynthesis glycosyltransferase